MLSLLKLELMHPRHSLSEEGANFRGVPFGRQETCAPEDLVEVAGGGEVLQISGQAGVFIVWMWKRRRGR